MCNARIFLFSYGSFAAFGPEDCGATLLLGVWWTWRNLFRVLEYWWWRNIFLQLLIILTKVFCWLFHSNSEGSMAPSSNKVHGTQWAGKWLLRLTSYGQSQCLLWSNLRIINHASSDTVPAIHWYKIVVPSSVYLSLSAMLTRLSILSM